jgi:hypothetical protein
MRMILWVSLWATLLTSNVQGVTLRYNLIDLGTATSGETLHRFTYSLSDAVIAESQEINIRFDPAVFRLISNPTAPPGFTTLVLQPDNPPGTFGDYSALAVIANPSLAGLFTVDFVLVHNGLPGPQPFSINQFDTLTGSFVRTVESGSTQLAGPAAVPEPRSFWLAGAGLILCCLWIARGRFLLR